MSGTSPVQNVITWLKTADVFRAFRERLDGGQGAIVAESAFVTVGSPVGVYDLGSIGEERMMLIASGAGAREVAKLVTFFKEMQQVGGRFEGYQPPSEPYRPIE